MTGSNKRYVALIRGINVGGNSIIRMAELRKLFESIGLTDVATYIQSGNVIFSTDADRETLSQQLEQSLKPLVGARVKVLVLSQDELKQAEANNPFEPEARDKIQKTHLLFLSDKPDKAHIEALMAKQGKEYLFHVQDKVLYYAYPNEFAANRRTIDFEKVLGVYGTSRRWNVVHKLIELLE